MGGLEPPRISPHAPQTCTSTIPPHRHEILLTFQFIYTLVSLRRMLTQGQPSFGNDTQSFPCGRVPHRHEILLTFQFIYTLVSLRRMLTQGQPSFGNDTQSFPCGRVPHRHSKLSNISILSQRKKFYNFVLLDKFNTSINDKTEANSSNKCLYCFTSSILPNK